MVVELENNKEATSEVIKAGIVDSTAGKMIFGANISFLISMLNVPLNSKLKTEFLSADSLLGEGHDLGIST